MRPATSRRVDAILFDLDGTLADSAPDLAGAVNDLRVARGLEALPYERLRPMVGSGARGMIGAAFGLAPGDAGFDSLREDFLSRYEQRILQETRLFDTIDGVLRLLEQQATPWGIVTNKLARYAAPLVRGLGLEQRCAALISGDTTAYAKPHPAPLLEAARRMNVRAERCVYVGDDHRDAQAGRAAGMFTLAAAWGYLGCGAAIDTWQTDGIVQQPGEVLQWLEMR